MWLSRAKVGEYLNGEGRGINSDDLCLRFKVSEQPLERALPWVQAARLIY